MEPTGYVSVIAVNLLAAITAQLEALESRPPVPPNELQTNTHENGHALAVVALGVLVLESAINRAGYIRGDRVRGKRLERPVDYFGRIVPEKNLNDEVAE